ncbi:hypothetical protein JXB41_01965 [Candidatus Woesearchaeota archaeon]|nr:hypothetical protein [Candidatus Woesearchaeota archaeon]
MNIKSRIKLNTGRIGFTAILVAAGVAFVFYNHKKPIEELASMPYYANQEIPVEELVTNRNVFEGSVVCVDGVLPEDLSDALYGMADKYDHLWINLVDKKDLAYRVEIELLKPGCSDDYILFMDSLTDAVNREGECKENSRIRVLGAYSSGHLYPVELELCDKFKLHIEHDSLKRVLQGHWHFSSIPPDYDICPTNDLFE